MFFLANKGIVPVMCEVNFLYFYEKIWKNNKLKEIFNRVKNE